MNLHAWRIGLLFNVFLVVFAALAGCDRKAHPSTAGDRSAGVASATPEGIAVAAESASHASASVSGTRAPTATPNVLPMQTTYWSVSPVTNRPKLGEVSIACEGGDVPSDVTGGCTCGAVILNPCDAVRPIHIVDRRQCQFECGSSDRKSVRLRCPDGTTPAEHVNGCACGPGIDRVLSACDNGARPTAVGIQGDVCTITCS